MDGTISLRRAERKVFMEHYRKDPDPVIRLRAHIVLLLAAGFSWSMIMSVLFCSTRTIARWKDRFERGGAGALLEETRGRRCGFGEWVITLVVEWVTERTPRDFGFLRSRWCCGVVVMLLAEVCYL